MTSKIQVNFWFERYWWYCLINCWNFHTIHVFEVIADISTELPCLSYLKNLGQLPVQGYLKGDNCIVWIFTISSLFMFSRSRNSLLTFLLSYDVWVTSIIQVNFRFGRYWWFCLMNFWNFHTFRVFEVRESLCFWGQRIIWWHSYWATMFGRPQKFRSSSGSRGFRGYPNIRSLTKSSKFISSRAKVSGRSHDQRFIVNFVVMSCNVKSCHVMPRHVTSFHVMPRYATSCHVMLCHATSRHVMPRHVMSCHVMSRHATSRHVISHHVTSCHVMSRHATSRNVTSCHVLPRHAMSRNVTSCHVVARHVTSKSRDIHTTNASLSTDFFHTQLIQIRHNRVRWLSEGCRYHTALAVYDLVTYDFHPMNDNRLLAANIISKFQPFKFFTTLLDGVFLMWRHHWCFFSASHSLKL